MEQLFDAIARSGEWLILLIVFAGPALEASVLAGIIVPGEMALFLGGVLASSGRVPLVPVFIAGASGAILGDTIGYWVGSRLGERVKAGRLGRLVGRARWLRAERHLQRRGFLAIAIGRFPAGVRSLVPGVAGAAHMPYRRFLLANVVGGVVWSTAAVFAGYLAGAAWQRYESAHLFATLAMMILVTLVFWLILRRKRHARS